VVYPLPALLFTGMLLFLFRLGARREIASKLRDNAIAAASFSLLWNVPSIPHGDTLENLARQLDPEQAQESICRAVEILIRKKALHSQRLLGCYYVVAIDGTGMLSFEKRHCPHCLTQTQDGVTRYYHPVLEAKLVTPAGLVLSLMTEFIENVDPGASKQDCELKAFYRLALRLKRRFPRLPISLCADSLYAKGPVFALCQRFGWRFMLVLKEGVPFLSREFAALGPLQPQNRLRRRCGSHRQVHQEFRWVQEIAYQDDDKREHRLHVLECLETKPNQDGVLLTTRFRWVTNHRITPAKVVELAEQGGRHRWKIENEGFNVQKNGGYGLEHAYTRNWTSAKVLYLLLQLAHMLAQLLEHGSLLRDYFPNGFGSARDLAFKLLEAWRNQVLRIESTARFQIRFDFDSS
jgi:hypothetical protein